MICPVCQGSGLTGRFSESGAYAIHYSKYGIGRTRRRLDAFGINLPILGEIRDGPCLSCRGSGEVSGEEYQRLTTGRNP
jgi:hypothetical protein